MIPYHNRNATTELWDGDYKMDPRLAQMLNKGPAIGQQPRPKPFRVRMQEQIEASKKALDKATYALKVYDNNEDVRKFIDFLETQE